MSGIALNVIDRIDDSRWGRRSSLTIRYLSSFTFRISEACKQWFPIIKDIDPNRKPEIAYISPVNKEGEIGGGLGLERSAIDTDNVPDLDILLNTLDMRTSRGEGWK